MATFDDLHARRGDGREPSPDSMARAEWLRAHLLPCREVGSGVPLLLEAARHMDILALQAREEALRALEAENDYGLMADRLRVLASRESVEQEWSEGCDGDGSLR